MRLNVIGILCSNVEASIGFYRSLGVSFPDYDPETGHYEADLGGGVRFLLDTYDVAEMFMDDFRPPTGNDQMGLAVEFDSPAEVDAAYAELTGAGHPGVKPPFDAFWGQRYATVADPDGNHVDLYATL